MEYNGGIYNIVKKEIERYQGIIDDNGNFFINFNFYDWSYDY